MARISTGTMTVGIFAVLFGLAGAYALRAALTGPEPEPPAPPRTVNVPLAAVTLPAGRQITMGDVVLVPMTADDMKSRGFPLEQTMLETGQIVGRIIEKDIKLGDPFLTTNFYPQGTGPKLSDKLKPGMRAVTIPIDNLAAVGGATVEGSFVDVLFRAKKRDADLDKGIPEIPATTVTLLENVEVLSVGRVDPVVRASAGETLDVRMLNGNDANQPKGVVSVTIAVSPDQANVVKAVLGQGDMSLALRGNSADNGVSPNKYTLEGIMGVKNPAVAGMDRIEIFRGNIGHQTVLYQNDKIIKNEVSVIPGVAPSTPFPVPAQVPTSPERPQTQPHKSFEPTPHIIDRGGYGYGGYGWPYGGYGRGYYGY